MALWQPPRTPAAPPAFGGTGASGAWVPAPTIATPSVTSSPHGLPLIVYGVGAVAVVAMADSRMAPVAVAFLAAVAIYNLNYLVLKFHGASAAGIANRNAQATRDAQQGITPGSTGFGGGGASGGF